MHKIRTKRIIDGASSIQSRISVIQSKFLLTKDKQARKILDKYGIEYDSAANGVFLPYVKDSKYIGDESKHIGNHSRKYIDYVTEKLRKVDTAGESKENILNEINTIRSELLEGKLKLNWNYIINWASLRGRPIFTIQTGG